MGRVERTMQANSSARRSEEKSILKRCPIPCRTWGVHRLKTTSPKKCLFESPQQCQGLNAGSRCSVKRMVYPQDRTKVPGGQGGCDEGSGLQLPGFSLGLWNSGWHPSLAPNSHSNAPLFAAWIKRLFFFPCWIKPHCESKVLTLTFCIFSLIKSIA